MKIILTDVHADCRRCMRVVLEKEGFDIVGEAGDGEQALQLVEQENPDIVILDMNTPRLNGFEVSREIIRRGLSTQVVILSMFEDDTSVLESFRAGVKAYVLKAHAATDLVLAIHQLERGKRYLSPAITDLVIDPYFHQQQDDQRGLTGIETEILQLLAQDKPKNDIARQLSLTIETLEFHRKAVMEKLQASNIGGLVRHAVRKGMLRA